jgi:PKD repeat protein
MMVAVLAAGCGGGGSGGGGGSIPILGPPPTAGIVAERTLVKAGVAVALSLDVEGLAPETFVWDFGDGEGLEGEGFSGASHSYAAEGSYVVTATATDAFGNTVGASVTIDVTPAGGAPVLTVESVELRGTVTDATPCGVTVNGAGPVEVQAGGFAWQDDLDASPETYDVRAVDEGGNVTAQTVTVTLVD